MKKTFKSLFLVALTSVMLTSCVGNDDTTLPNYKPVVFGEDFETNAIDKNILDLPGWTNFAEVGTTVWRSEYHSSNNYAIFAPYNSPVAVKDVVSVGWLITPAITLGAHENERLVFQSAMSYVKSTANSLEILISTDYDGTNVTAANWEPLEATLPTLTSKYFEFIKSGEVSLAGYTGPVHIAFKVKGSGVTANLTGAYQIDNVRVFY